MHASAEETFCLTATEALTCALPCRSFQAGGLGGVDAIHGRTRACWFGPREARALAATMQRLPRAPRPQISRIESLRRPQGATA